MIDQPVVKHTPEDFLVRENMVAQLCKPSQGQYRYALLRKQGYTTTEAVELIADRLGLASLEISYGGRKDEDAVTEQLISLPRTASWPEPQGCWSELSRPERWLEIHHYGYGRTPLRIGQVEGNGFRVVVRNLDREQAGRLRPHERSILFFLNYYDIQRFGVPGGPKRTHLVGKAMLEGRWDNAMEELMLLGAPESAGSRDWVGPAKAYFERLDPRTRAFFLAAHEADRWNEMLAERVTASCPSEEQLSVTVEGIRFRYASSPEATMRVLSHGYGIPYKRYEYQGDALIAHELQRATIIQTFVTAEDPGEDPHFPGRYAMALKFFLPSGCYGTAALRQLLLYMTKNQDVSC